MLLAKIRPSQAESNVISKENLKPFEKNIDPTSSTFTFEGNKERIRLTN